MLLNDDLFTPAVVHAGRLEWTPSPSRGVDRRMLFRIGEETARATSIVRYAPNSQFPRHAHPGGEEFLVLEGTFQDETGDFPAGTYVRNPPGSAHAPGSAGGCTIFVKLWQFRADDRERVIRHPGQGMEVAPAPGVASSLILFESPWERVAIEEWQADTGVVMANPRGLELLVLSGSFIHDGETCEPLSWLRLPPGYDLRVTVGSEGARVWFKSAALLLEGVCAF